MSVQSGMKTLPHTGSFMIQISSRFIPDLKQLAELKGKMDEMDELGKLLKRSTIFVHENNFYMVEFITTSDVIHH